MRLRLFVTAAALLTANLAAHADTISTFNIQGNSIFVGFGDAKTITGTSTIDVTTGAVQAISFTVGGLTESGVNSQSNAEIYVGQDNVDFTFTGASLIAFNGGTFNLRTADDLYVGQVNFTPAAAITPEPSSLVLLGTGLLGVVGIVRKRLA